MNVHVLLDTTFFGTSVPVGDQQRLLPVPAGKGLHVGDVVFLRDATGTLTWVGDVLAGGEIESTAAWSDPQSDEKQRHAIVGYLARIHPDALPRGTSKLAARWVTLNKRTLPGTLPWWSDHILVYHSTVRLIEAILTPEQAQQAESRGYLNKHPSGHWTIPHGEARKRIMVDILNIDLTCGLCGGPISALESATQDHIIPISQGGPDTLANVQLAHRACNELKGNALPEQYPPFFPQPGDTAAGWYGRAGRNARSGRGGRNNRARRGQQTTPAAAFQVEAREIPATKTTTPESAAKAVAADKAAAASNETTAAAQNGDAATTSKSGKQTTRTNEATTKKAAAAKSTAATKTKSAAAKKTARTTEAADTPTEVESSDRGTDGASNGAATQEQDKQSAAQAPLSPEEHAWLADVQGARLERLQEYAKKPQWAARTASLRTLEQLPRARAGKARAQGTLLAEASGPKGRFQLLHWEDQHVLVEERGRRQTLHLVQMSAAIAPEAYVSYLTRFGRTSPLAVIMALLSLWHKGAPDQDGRLSVTKNNIDFVIVVADDRIAECAKQPSLAAS